MIGQDGIRFLFLKSVVGQRANINIGTGTDLLLRRETTPFLLPIPRALFWIFGKKIDELYIIYILFLIYLDI